MKEHDKTATRLVGILSKFNNGEQFTANELAHEFNVSIRTIQRDLNERLGFLPILKHNGYYCLEDYALGKLSFKDIQNFATISGIDTLYPSLDRGFITDILNEKIHKAYLVKSSTRESLASTSALFSELSVAILRQLQVTFIYHERGRRVSPYKLIHNAGVWYLAALEDDTLKNYTLSKIQRLQITTEVYIPSGEILSLIEAEEIQWFSQETFEVLLQIDSEVQEYFLHRTLFPNQQIIDQTQSHLILSTKVSYDTEILATVKQWLPHIRILSPLHLQEQLENILTGYLQTTQPVVD